MTWAMEGPRDGQLEELESLVPPHSLQEVATDTQIGECHFVRLEHRVVLEERRLYCNDQMEVPGKI